MNIKIVVYLSLLFFLSELILRISKHSTRKERKTTNDRKSLTIFWITIPLSLTMGFFTANYHLWNTLQYSLAAFGLIVFATGLVIRWVSIIQLDRGFTVDVTIIKDHSLKTDGIYKTIRHPGYLGLLLICLGLSIAMNSVISLLIVSIPIYVAICYRIKIEESILIDAFGDHYRQYILNSHQLLPMVKK